MERKVILKKSLTVKGLFAAIILLLCVAYFFSPINWADDVIPVLGFADDFVDIAIAVLDVMWFFAQARKLRESGANPVAALESSARIPKKKRRKKTVHRA
ncbi:DUF1232 domain-containing protein [Patescibacteria group bacterium]|nr:DUF1232 domain-containing protein [Patescibacteria group bacterium]